MTLTAAGFLDAHRALVAERLEALLAQSGNGPDRLLRSMRHSLLAPAKRVRPLLTLIAAKELGGREDAALDLGCALEMVHAASLILDDLPAMDNADLRRGLPSNHRVFGDATAILAAIGLMNRAFGVAAECQHLPGPNRLEAVDVLHRAIGVEGLVGGQEEDLHDCRSYSSAQQLEAMYGRKTGALFAAAMELGAIAAGQSEARAPFALCGHDLGVGFQILDDVVDAQAEAGRAGKDVLKDRSRPNFASLLGAGSARARGQAKIEKAVAAATDLASRHGGTGRHLAAFTEHLMRAFSDVLDERGAVMAAGE